MNIMRFFNFKKKADTQRSKSKTSNSNTLTDSELNTIASTDFSEIPTEIPEHLKRKKSKIHFPGINKRVNEEKEFLTSEDSKLLSEVSLRDIDEYVESDSKNHSVTQGTTSTQLLSGDGMEYKKLPIVGRLPVKQQYQLIGLVALLSLVILASGVVVYGDAANRQSTAIKLVNEVSTEVQKTNFYFNEAISGKNNATVMLNDMFNKTVLDYNELKKYNLLLDNSDVLLPYQENIDKNIAIISQNINKLNVQAPILNNTDEKVNALNEEINSLNIKIDNFINLYDKELTNQNELANAYSLKTYLQAIGARVSNILLMNKVDINKVEQLSSLGNELKNSLISIHSGNESKYIKALSIQNKNLNDSYFDVANSWIKLSSQLDDLVNKSGYLIETKELLSINESVLNDIMANMSALNNIYSKEDITGFWKGQILLLIGVIILVFALVTTFYIYSYEKDNRSSFEKLENNKNQFAVIKLLEDLGPLQNGDLTKKTTVTDEITGAIADSVNAAIDSLASLVRKVKDTTVLMRKKTKEVHEISQKMLVSSENQAADLNITGSSVIEIGEAITEISERTSEGVKEASRSVEISEKGAIDITNSIKTMETINSHMNITVELMQKVGRSSSQISEIVDVLSDISQETSILALNATVQAAKAGEAGKSFKVVADAIQELADKAGNATRTVGALINTIQTGIVAVEDSIKQTNQEVDSGVKQSEAVKESLTQMIQASRNLSDMILEISEETRDRALNARKISDSMKNILKTTEDNKESTEKTVESLAEISEISNDLGNSVQSFKID